MCRNIKRLFNFEPHVTNDEIHAASLQFVRKVSGFTHPSKMNEKAFNESVDEVAHIIGDLMDDLVTDAPPHNREIEKAKAHARAVKRFGKRQWKSFSRIRPGTGT